jgi:manganese/iron transport system permease protein
MSALVEPFHLHLHAASTAEVVLMSVVCGVLGVFVVLRGLTYTGESLAHARPGAAVAVAVGSRSPARCGRRPRGARDRVLRTGGREQRDGRRSCVQRRVCCRCDRALHRRDSEEIDGVLFGSILAVGPRDLWFSGSRPWSRSQWSDSSPGACLQLPSIPFARSLQIRPLNLGVLLQVTLALALTVALSAMGTLPRARNADCAATARILAGRAWTMLWIAPIAGLVAGVAVSRSVPRRGGGSCDRIDRDRSLPFASVPLWSRVRRSQGAGENPALAGQARNSCENSYHQSMTTATSDSWGDHARNELRRSSARTGGAREAVITYLEDQNCCLSAQGLFDGFDKAIAPSGSQAYRVLEQLMTSAPPPGRPWRWHSFEPASQEASTITTSSATSAGSGDVRRRDARRSAPGRGARAMSSPNTTWCCGVRRLPSGLIRA